MFIWLAIIHYPHQSLDRWWCKQVDGFPFALFFPPTPHIPFILRFWSPSGAAVRAMILGWKNKIIVYAKAVETMAEKESENRSLGIESDFGSWQTLLMKK